MTLAETRQLGIEFERRIQQMSPEREFLDKLDTETIYSYLNQFQDKYIKDIYRSLDQIPADSNVASQIETIVASLLKSKTITEGSVSTVFGKNAKEFLLPDDFYVYIESASVVSEMYNAKKEGMIVANKLVSQADALKLTSVAHDSLRVLRNPAVVLTDMKKNLEKKDVQTLTIIYDSWTEVTGLKVVYYKMPKQFDIMTSTPCELPLSAFDDLVSGAIELYLEHASLAAKEAAVKQRQAAAQKNAQKQQEGNE